MIWTAVVPIKPFEEAKTRLSCDLTAGARAALAKDMFRHVTSVLDAHPLVGRLVIVSQSKIPGCPGEWFRDARLGLNAALEAARRALGQPLAIFHADLPLLCDDDVTQLLATAADTGLAIAPDRHRRGTNALALGTDFPFHFRFGTDSYARHLEQAQRAPGIVQTIGLGHDCDTIEDLANSKKLATLF